MAFDKILFVDDDEKYAASIKRALHSKVNIVTTKDPIQALNIIKDQGPFAAVISDYRMPCMNGVELLSQIIAIDESIQRIILTGCADLQMAMDAVNHGKITAFLTKPVPIHTLRSVVFSAIEAYKKGYAGPVLPKTNIVTAQPKLYDPLTIKEKEVLSLLAKGLSNAEISQKLYITVGTVKCHVSNLFSKMNVHSRSKIVAKGLELGLITRNGTVS